MKMKNHKTKFVRRWSIWTAVAIGAFLLNAPQSFADEAKSAPPAAAAKSDAADKSTPLEPAAKETDKNVTTAAEKPAEKASAPVTKPTETAPAAAPAATSAPP